MIIKIFVINLDDGYYFRLILIKIMNIVYIDGENNIIK